MTLEYLLVVLGIVWGAGILLFVISMIIAILQKDRDNFNLTKEDYDFLIELQHELLTQDHVCQAAPRFWVVATDKYQIPGNVDSCEGAHLYCSDEGEIVCDGDIKSIIDYVVENYMDELQNITFRKKDNYWIAEIEQDGKTEEESIYCSEDLLEFLKDNNVLSDVYDFIYYHTVHYNYPNTMFLTNRSCKEHIKANHYHYNDDAHSYAMTAWRSPEVEHLWNILETIDWKTLRYQAYGYDNSTEVCKRSDE